MIYLVKAVAYFCSQWSIKVSGYHFYSSGMTVVKNKV